jgi:P4 family phage/plasmid primase-like protien
MSMRVASDCEPDGLKNARRESLGLNTPSVSCNSYVNGVTDDVASYWRRRADELAVWTERRMVNRRDIFGGYYLDDDGKVQITTSHDSLTRERIVRHHGATSTADVLGLHTTARVILEEGLEPCLSLWLGVDIDQHGHGDFSQANHEAALAWRDVLIGLGFHPLLIDSNGKRGFHLRVLFDEPTLTAHVRNLGRWLIRDWQARGLEVEPEVFPKQAEIVLAGPGSCGNWLRLPGRHPKCDHWSSVLEGSELLRGDEAIDFILGLPGDPAQLIPNEALCFSPQCGRQSPVWSGEPKTADEARFAKEGLQYLGAGVRAKNGREYFDHYSSWLMIGMALTELGDVGLELWEAWSKQSMKYETAGPNSCAAKWATFKAAGNQGVRLGTLFYYAKAHGWPGFGEGLQLAWPAQSTNVNEAADDPHRLARLHLSKFQHSGLPMLRFYRGEWFAWSNGAYRPIAESELQAGLAGTIKSEFDRLNLMAVELWEKNGGKDASGKPVDKPVVRKVTRPLASNATLAMQSMAVLRGKPDAPFWIEGDGPFHPADVMPIRNALVNLPGVVTGDMVDPSAFMMAPTPCFFSTYSLDFDFDLDVGPPVELLKFLTSVWPEDRESIDALQEWFGYCLTPDTRQQKIGMFVGPMRSGRGTIARLMSALVGRENVAGPRLSALGTNFGLEPLVGKPLAIIGDARLSRRTDTGAIVEAVLSISGEDTITIDRKHRAPWTGKLPTRLILLSNELPRLPDQSGALASRFLVWRFTKSFLGKEDLGLDTRLAAELPAILLWAIEGWKRLRQRRHFRQPESGSELVDEVRDISSPIGAFVRDRVEVKVGSKTDVVDLYSEWCQWCEAKKCKPGDELIFGRNLRTVLPGLETKTRRGEKKRGEKPFVRYFQGLEIKRDEFLTQ